MKKLLKWLGIFLLIGIVIGGILYLVYVQPFISKMKNTEVVVIDESLTYVIGGGGNSGIISSDSLVIVIDTKMDDAAKMLHELSTEKLGNRKLLVVNTHWHPDHVGGNKLYKGNRILAGGTYTADEWKKENNEESLPTDWLKDRLVITMGKDTVTIFNLAKNVHTQSDVMVFMHQHGVLFGGDVILNKQCPILMGKADPQGYIDVLSRLNLQYRIKSVVPGHGAVGGNELVTRFYKYFVDMKLAASNRQAKKELVDKYESWNQIPFFMSPNATIKLFKK